MPGESASAAPPPTRKKQKRPRNPIRREDAQPELERLNSLPWSASLPETGPFAFLDGTGEGGFLTLEEIDEAEYGIVGGDGVDGLKVSKKRKEEGKLEEDESCVSEAGEEEKKVKNDKRKKKLKKKKKKDKKRNALKKKRKEAEKEEKEGIEEKEEETVKGNDEEGSDNSNDGAAAEEEIALEESECYAWNELRLHPLLMKSIHKLGFKEPTPIQKACIPAAAHQGKDVIGAAETGSGKTLAFGLPILQRLLEEREKSSRLLEKGKAGVGVHQKSSLRALIVTPTRELALQVSDHLKEAAKLTNIQVVPIVGGMSTEKQERLLKRMPEIIVGTPGRLWELMSGGEQHLVELQCLSFFVLDEADRMIEYGHFQELQSIIDMLPTDAAHPECQLSGNCKTVPNVQLKKRQTFVFSATIALSDSFRKKLKHRALNPKSGTINGLSSIETLSERAGIKANVAIVDLTKASIVAEKLEESFIECTEENKEAYLYYILSVHGHGRTIVFCTSIAALRRMASLLRILGINAWTLHAQMQQRARLKAIDRFRGSDHAILVATDVAARGLDIPGVRTVVHFQLPHSAEVYIHRSGRTARASADGCCIALISPSDRAKFFSLCKSLSKGGFLVWSMRLASANAPVKQVTSVGYMSEHVNGHDTAMCGNMEMDTTLSVNVVHGQKENLLRFPLNESYLPEIFKRMSLACQIDKLLRKNSQENVKKSWFERNAESMELLIDESDSEEEVVKSHRQKKIGSLQLQKLQQELKVHLAKPLQPKQFSHRFLAGAGVSPLLQQQLEELSKQNREEVLVNERRPKLVIIGQDCVEPLQALRNSGHEVCLNTEKRMEMRKLTEHLKRKRRQDKKSEREQRIKKRKMTN